MDTKLTPPSTPPPITPSPVPVGTPPENKTDVMGIISLACAFFGLQLPGFIIGLIGAKKAKEEGRSATLSKVGWIINLILMIIVILVLVPLLVLGFIGANQASKTAQDISNSSQSRVNEATSQKAFKKGETAQFGDLDVAVTSVMRNYVPVAEYRRAPAGKELIVLDLSITNKGKENASVASYNFKVDENGVQTNTSYVDGPGKQLESVQLAPGATVSGQIVFEVTANATGLKLISDDYVYDSTTYRSEKVDYSLEF